MAQEEVFKELKRYFPDYYIGTKEWFPNGRNSIRVRLYNGSDFIFTFYNENDWCFETVDSHIRKMKGEKK